MTITAATAAAADRFGGQPAVVDGGTTNRSFLVGLLDRPELSSGDFDNRWLDRLTAAGEHVQQVAPRRRVGIGRFADQFHVETILIRH